MSGGSTTSSWQRLILFLGPRALSHRESLPQIDFSFFTLVQSEPFSIPVTSSKPTSQISCNLLLQRSIATGLALLWLMFDVVAMYGGYPDERSNGKPKLVWIFRQLNHALILQ